LVKTGEFKKTAELLSISSATLTKHMKYLEREIGAPLLNRTTRAVEINEFGILFLPYAQQLVEIHSQLVEEAADLKKSNVE